MRYANTMPMTIMAMFFTIGNAMFANIDPVISFPDIVAASDREILKATSPITLSTAMTCNNVLTKSPFAFICRMVIMVDVDAVTAANVDKTSESAKLSLKMPKSKMNIRSDAAKDSKSAMIKDFIPLFLNVENKKCSPTQKAMNANAISARKSVPLMTLLGMRSRKYGPISIPVIIYAVTLGSRKSHSTCCFGGSAYAVSGVCNDKAN